MPLSKDYIYLAGIVDGEGTIRIHKANAKYYRIALRIASNSTELIEYLKDTFGGNSWIVAKEGQRGNNRESYCWEITGHILYEILNQIEPYVIIKKPQLLLAKEYVKTISRKTKLGLSECILNQRDYIINQFSLVNARGLQTTI